MDPVVIAALISAGSQLLGGLTGDKGGGAGGATSANVQPGQTGLQYQDVQGTGISPFEYQEYQEQLADEEKEREIADAMALAQQQGLWSGGIIGLMQGGPLYANEGLEIEDSFPPMDEFIDINGISIQKDPFETPTFDSSITVEETPEDVETEEGLGSFLKSDEGKATLIKTIGNLLASEFKARNTSPSVSPRKSVTPLPGGGLGKRQAPYPEPKGSGITPFMYRGVADGGVLGRSMFAQNYMPHGGAMQGPGGPKDDLIPVMASDGEYMLSKAAVDQAGGGNHARGIANLEQFNNMGNRRYG